MPSSFVPVAAVVCPMTTQPERAPTALQSTAVGGLVAALRLPPLPMTADACTLPAIGLPWWALLDARGRWVLVTPPDDGCGYPRREVLDALDAVQRAARPWR